jgi:hypothetical protein
MRLGEAAGRTREKEWLRGLDSNQDKRLQRPLCYQLHYPGVATKSVADIPPILFPPYEFVQLRCVRLPPLLEFASLLKPLTPERCPSGLRSTLGKRV